MIDTAWDEYRAWAARARALQTASQRWNTAALVSAGAAAALGAAAIQFSAYPRAMQALSLLSALAGSVPFLGKEILTSGAEAKWIRDALLLRRSSPVLSLRGAGRGLCGPRRR